MAGNSYRDLVLKFRADVDELEKGTDAMRKEVKKASDDAEKEGGKAAKGYGDSFGSKLKEVAKKVAGPLAALFAADKIKDFAVSAVKQASDLNETLNKSSVIFGSHAKEIERWGSTAAKNLGLSKEQAVAAAAGFGDMLSQIGFTGAAATKNSKQVVQMAADLGSFNNLDTSDVLERISASLRGEYDSLQAVIPNINAARVQQVAMAQTGKTSAAALTAQEKATATLAIIQKDGARAQGDFARTSGGLANQQKIAAAQVKDLQAQLGTALLPTLTKLMKFVTDSVLPGFQQMSKAIGDMIGWFKEWADVIVPLVVGFGALTAAIIAYNAAQKVSEAGGLIKWFKQLSIVTKAQTVQQILLNTAMWTNPIFLVVAALIALGVAFVIAYKKSETFRKFINALWDGIRKGAKAFANFITKTIPAAFQAVVNWVRKNWTKAVFLNPVTAAIYLLIKHRDRIKAIFNNLVGWIRTTFRKAWGGVKGIVSGPVSAARTAISNLFGRIRNTFNNIKNWVRDTWRKGWNNLSDWLTAPIRRARTAISGLFTGKRGLGTVFRNAVSTFGRIWSGLKAAIGKPLNAVINFINQGLIRNGINRILNALGVPKKQQIPWIPPVKYARGGPIRGRGSGTSDSVLMRGSAGEHVLTAEEVRKFGGHSRVMAWRKAIRTGQAYDYPGYAAGGVVRPVPGGFGRFPSYPGHTGVDFPVGMNTPVHAVMAGIIKSVRSLTTSYGRHIIQSLPIAGNYEALYAHLNSFRVRPGQHVGAGQVIAMSDDSGNSTGPHLHFTLQHPGGNYVDPTSFLNGGAAPAGGGGGVMGTVIGFLKGIDPVKWLTNRASSLKNQILGKIGGSPFAQGLANIPMVIIRKAATYLKEKLFGGIGAGQAEPAGSGVERWRGVIRTALGMNHLPTTDDYVNAWLRQVQSESGGNPRAVQHGYTDVNTITGDLAKGLLQTIGATFNAYKFPGHGDIFNGFDNALAAIAYAKSRYGAQGMLGVIGHGHGYDAGGMLPPGVSLAMNGTGSPEPVLTGRQWSTLGSQPSIVINVNGALDPDAVARQIETLLTRYGRLRNGITLNRGQGRAVAG